VSGIDIIVGGHSATVPETCPAVVSAHGAPTLVVQAGEFRNYLGKLDVVFNRSGVLQSWQGELIAIDETIKENTAIAAKLAEYQEPVAELMNNIIGHTNVFLDGETENVRSMETNLGNMVADAVLDKTKSTGATIAILNGGSIRASIPAGDISLGQVIEVFPYENYLVVIDLSGEQIIAALENGVSQVEEVAGRFPQVAGLRFTWNPDNPAGSRITGVEVKDGNGYSPIEADATYRVAINNFLYQGGDGYTVFQEGTGYINAGFIYYEILAEYIENNSPLAPQIEGRITSQSG
jgi:2',3'-cyclic-nucleotide 2'-phosphodiesterase (5'-nucleotidase family)